MVIGLPPDGLTPAWARDFAMFPPAGVILFARDFADPPAARALIARLRALAAPRRLFVALDEEGGWVSQLAGHFVVPPNAALLARGAEPGDLRAIADVTARRLRALGFDWDFAPVADVHSEPDNPVIGPRAYGTTAREVSERLGELLAGYRAGGMATCLKHFPGHGDTRTDSHLALPFCEASAATLESRELAPFRAALAADSIMTAHVVYRALDADAPATFSRAIVQGLLRDRLGYAGVVITDALEMQGAAAGRSPAEAGRLALAAGCDVLLYATWTEEVRRARLELARSLADDDMDRAPFDDARPRLAAFDAATPPPTEAEFETPLEALTPADWEPRLERIIERGLVVRGALPPTALSGAWAVEEPAYKQPGPMRAHLVAEGLLVDAGAQPAANVIAVSSRVPLTAERIAELRARCAERPTILAGLQNDAFLDHVPEAAVTISAADETPLTRRVLARRIAALARQAAETRA